MRRAAVLLLLAGCGDNLGDDRTTHGGDRLRLVEYVYDDGTREADLAVFHDAERGERCRPTAFSDGARYCAPEGAGGETVFVDAACASSLGLVPSAETAPTYFRRFFELHGTRTLSRLYTAGAPAAQPSLVWKQQDGYCLGPISAAAGAYYELGDEIGPADLVRIRESSQLAGERLAVAIDTSSDGLRVPGAFSDLDVMEACTMTGGANMEEVACVPGELPMASSYADAACTQPVVTVGVTSDAVLARYRDPVTSCWSLLELGDALPADATLYARVDSSCVVLARPGGTVARATGAVHEVATAARVAVPGDGSRLSTVELHHGPIRVPAGTLHDATLGAECRHELRGSEHVCVPIPATDVQTVFADSACSTPMQLAFVVGGGCHPPARYAARDADRYPIGAPHTQPFYELEPGDRCGTLQAPPGFVAHALGDALPDSAFARAVIEIAD